MSKLSEAELKAAINDPGARALDKLLNGRKIVLVRRMTTSEAEDCGWESRPVVLILDDNSFLIPQSDDEANDAGAIAHVTLQGLETLGYVAR
jgi:hypothetical protein